MTESHKKCSTCKEVKSTSEFSKSAGEKDGLQARCKGCAADNYRKNKVTICKQVKDRKERIRQEGRALVWTYLLEHPCVDCGETDPVVLDFDHVRGTKKAHVSTILLDGRSLKSLAEEIAKCEVRCSNCHRRRTALSFGWYRGIFAARARQDGHQTFNLD